MKKKTNLYEYELITDDTQIELPKIDKNTAFAFDIETTTFNKNSKYYGTMYIWQLAINEHVYIGRTWENFTRIIEEICNKYPKINIIIWIHNLSFEFSFIKGLFKWNETKKGVEVFAKSERDIIYARYKNIEFRDSLSLTNAKLQDLPKIYNLETKKLVGDLDYNKTRHFKTKLTDEEINYCINDVLILTEWHKKYIIPEFYEKKIDLPLTSTGIVRNELKANFSKMLSKEEQKEYKKQIKKAQPSEDIYNFFRTCLFRGGLTHANTALCNTLIDEIVASFDLKSAHPSQMLTRKFPYKFYRANKKKFKEILQQAREDNIAFFGSFTFKNICSKTYHCLESKNKIIAETNAVYENGRLDSAEEITVALTELDYFNYEMIYDWDEVKVNFLYESKKDYLPAFLRKTVLYYFYLKESMPKNAMEYVLSKRKLNSLFGACATGIVENELEYNFDSQNFDSSASRSYKEAIKGQILLPQWAIWIAAYTRNDMTSVITKTGKGGIDSIYYDTDSDKVKNPEENAHIFAEFNAKKIELNKTINTYEYDPKIIQKIGCFEHEYDTSKIKVLGAKRYVVEHDGKTEVVVAGMVKGSFENYCKYHNIDIYDNFKNGLYLPPEFSEKKTTSYTDTPFTFELTDYTGNTQKIAEKSSCAIFSIPFKLSVMEEFLKQIEIKTQKRKNEFYKGAL